jgi:hypothetical protein
LINEVHARASMDRATEREFMAELNGTAPVWRKSTASQNGDCVEVAFSGGSVLVRDSKDAQSPVLSFTSSEWVAFLAGARNGEFNQR